jgi:hypothetical protein
MSVAIPDEPDVGEAKLVVRGASSSFSNLDGVPIVVGSRW